MTPEKKQPAATPAVAPAKPVLKTPAAPTKAIAPAKGPKSNVTPEQQAQYDQVMIAARKSLYGDAKDDTRFKMVLQRLAAAKGELPNAIGSITAVVLTNIAGTAKKQGREIPPPILFHAGREIVADLVEISVSAQLMPKEQAAEVTKAATLEAMKTFKQGGGPAPQQPGQPAQATPAKPAQAPAAAPAPPPARGIIDRARVGA